MSLRRPEMPASRPWWTPGQNPRGAAVAGVPATAAHDDGLQSRLNDYYNSLMYSDVIDEYSEFSGFHNYGYWTPQTRTQKEACEKLVDLLIDFLPRKQGQILDVACGKGASTKRLLRHYLPSQIIGINISEKQLVTCRKRAPGCRFVNMDATQLRFPSNTFENILCIEAAFHFDTREKFLREALRVLQPGGHLALSDILFYPWAAASLIVNYIPAANLISDIEQYRALLERIGFENVRIIEAREQCWEGFRDHSFDFVRRRVLSGQAPFSLLTQARIGQRWRDWLYSDYLLVDARKPDRGRR